LGRAAKSTKLALSDEVATVLEKGLSPRILSAMKPILAKARKLCRNSGAVRAMSLAGEGLSEADVRQILSSDGFAEVYPGWWVKQFGDSVPARIARKVIAYCGPVSPSTVRHALKRHLARFEFPTPPSEVLVIMLEQTRGFALVDGLLRLTEKPFRDASLTRPENIFMNLVHTEGPIVSYESLYKKLVADQGFSVASLWHLLALSPIVQKVAYGFYSLVGAKCDAVDIERAKYELTRVRANSTIRPRPDGVVEIEANV